MENSQSTSSASRRKTTKNIAFRLVKLAYIVGQPGKVGGVETSILCTNIM